MTRGPVSFKESDLIRAIRCAIKAELHVAGFEITRAGNILVHAGKPEEVDTAEDADRNPWDKAVGRP